MRREEREALSLSLSTFSFSHSACWCTGVAGVIVRNMRVCVFVFRQR